MYLKLYPWTVWAKTLYLNLPFEIIVLVQYVKCLYFVFIVIKCRDITDLFSLSYNVDKGGLPRTTLPYIQQHKAYRGGSATKHIRHTIREIKIQLIINKTNANMNGV